MKRGFFFLANSTSKMYVVLKKWDSHVITALRFDVGLLLAAIQDDLAVLGVAVLFPAKLLVEKCVQSTKKSKSKEKHVRFEIKILPKPK